MAFRSKVCFDTGKNCYVDVEFLGVRVSRFRYSWSNAWRVDATCVAVEDVRKCD